MSNDLDEALAATTCATEEDAAKLFAWLMWGEQIPGTLDAALPIVSARLWEAAKFYARQHLRSHPAPPPLPGDENAVEVASDEELAGTFLKVFNEQRGSLEGVDAGRRALYDLGRQHQASADAATIAALKRVSDAAFVELADGYCPLCDGFGGEHLAMAPALHADPRCPLDALPAYLRPEPGGTK